MKFLDKGLDEDNVFGSLHEYLKYCAVIGVISEVHGPLSKLMNLLPPTGIAKMVQFSMGQAVVGVNSWVAHRNHDIFSPDPDIFRPERWLDEDKAKLSQMDGYWMPFGSGSRTCIGKNISLLEMNKLIPAIVKKFEFFEAPNCKPVDDDVWLVKQKGVMCKVTIR
ncbi:hypothetical protein ACHAQA_005133 [Verticillium albo-atrum]